MNPHDKWCHNPRCRAYGRPGEGHVVIHTHKERRYQCKRCRRTFTQTKGSALYRSHKPRWLMNAVLRLLAYGCPVPAVVAAFDLDERTVACWQRESGSQCKRVHEHLVEGGEKPAVVGRGHKPLPRWAVDTLAAGADTSMRGPVEHILMVTDGLASYKSQAQKVFRRPLRTGKVGRPTLVLAEGVIVARVIKRCQRKRVVEVVPEVLCGAKAEVISRVIGTQRLLRALINTAYIERLNATFRERLAPLARRTRAGAHKPCTREAGMWLVGTTYNFVWRHCSLGEGRTPAMAAGLAEHRWSRWRSC
jgi:transposase-like protein